MISVNPGSEYRSHPLFTEATQGVTTDGFLSQSRKQLIDHDFVKSVALLHADSVGRGSSSEWQAAIDKLQREDIASKTYERPKTTEEIQALIQGYINNRERVMSFQIAAKDLARLHPGSVSAKGAEHLHPYMAGLSTPDFYDDEEMVTIVWRYPKPKAGHIHPDPVQLTDGSLRAAFLTKDAGDLSKFEDYQAGMMDYLHGNKHALDKKGVMRVLYGLRFRFHSYFRGIKEGLVSPRFNGTIGANLLITSLAISAALYAIFYFLDYMMTMERLKKAHSEGSKTASAAPVAGS